jgi:hypothetical protein
MGCLPVSVVVTGGADYAIPEREKRAGVTLVGWLVAVQYQPIKVARGVLAHGDPPT